MTQCTLRAGLSAFLLIICCGAFTAQSFLIHEKFDEGWDMRWVHSSKSKYDGRFKSVSPVPWLGDSGITLPDKSKHYGLTTILPEPVDPTNGLVVQYEVKFADSITCGGAYLKLLTHNAGFKAGDLEDSTPYSIMFGPDKCGSPYGKIHVILRHRNPKNGSVEEKHLTDAPAPITDTNTHVYTLVLNKDNTFEVLVDGEEKAAGSLFDKFNPPINPPKEIPDPEDKKPADWVDDAKMLDPAATKPDDWVEEEFIPDEKASKPDGWLDDEPALIPDPEAKKPAEWDDDEDGEWSSPQIANPKCKEGCGTWQRPTTRNPAYKGPWVAPLIDNPAYKGPWKQATIPNPDFYEDKTPLAAIGSIGAVAFELWTIDSGYTFDNLVITDDEEVAESIRDETWAKKLASEKAATDKKVKEEAHAATVPGRQVADWLIALFDTELMAPVKPHAQPLIKALERNPLIALVLVSVPALLLLVIISSILRPKRRQAAVDNKKTDAAVPDDEEEEEDDEEGEEAKVEAEGNPTPQEAKSLAAEAKAAAAEVVGEIEAEPPTEGTTRRRTPHA